MTSLRKYVVVTLRADNAGEGGTLSLLALVQQKLGTSSSGQRALVALAALGTAMFYGDALITPAISVLSAVEGLELLDPTFAAWSCRSRSASSLRCSRFQRRGTARVGRLFGPIMMLWFGTLAEICIRATNRAEI